MGFLDRIQAEKEAKEEPDLQTGVFGVATYACGLAIEAGVRVLPAQSAVRCTDEPSIRQLHNVWTVDPKENLDWLNNTKKSRDKVLKRRYRERGMDYSNN